MFRHRGAILRDVIKKGYHTKSLMQLLHCVLELTYWDYIPLFYKSLRMASREETCSGFKNRYEKVHFWPIY